MRWGKKSGGERRGVGKKRWGKKTGGERRGLGERGRDIKGVG